jgi:hypothetical protein
VNEPVDTVRQMRVTDPFWTVRAPEGEEQYPLPHSDANYQSSDKLLDFIGCGFGYCWLDPETFGLWELVERDHIAWLREYFLRMLEYAVFGCYTNTFYPGMDCSEIDWSGYDSLSFGGEDMPDVEECHLTWSLDRIEDDGVTLLLTTTGSDDVRIHLALNAIRDMRYVRTVVAYARHVNGLKVEPEQHNQDLWAKLNVPDLSGEYIAYRERMKSSGCRPVCLDAWYKDEYENEHPFAFPGTPSDTMRLVMKDMIDEVRDEDRNATLTLWNLRHDLANLLVVSDDQLSGMIRDPLAADTRSKLVDEAKTLIDVHGDDKDCQVLLDYYGDY